MHPYGHPWPKVLKIVARGAFALKSLDPADLTVFVDFTVLLDPPVPGQQVPGSVLAACFLAQCIKWPPLVAPEGPRLKATPLSSAKDCLGMYRRAIAAADGQAWPEMFKIMNAGGWELKYYGV